MFHTFQSLQKQISATLKTLIELYWQRSLVAFKIKLRCNTDLVSIQKKAAGVLVRTEIKGTPANSCHWIWQQSCEFPVRRSLNVGDGVNRGSKNNTSFWTEHRDPASLDATSLDTLSFSPSHINTLGHENESHLVTLFTTDANWNLPSKQISEVAQPRHCHGTFIGAVCLQRKESKYIH